MKYLLAFALMVAASTCEAQKDPLAMHCDRISDQTLCTVTRSFDNEQTPAEPTGVLRTVANAMKGGRDFVWSLWGIVNSDADYGQNVAVTGQCFGNGGATCWGGVLEAHATTQRSNIVGAEVDAMGSGMLPPGGYRVGIQLLLGKSRLATDPGPAELLTGLDIVPQNWATQDIRVRTAINIGAIELCTSTCIRLPNGGAITWDGAGGDVVEKFNPQTGYKGLWNHSRELFAVNLTHGGLHLQTVPCPVSAFPARECVRVNESGYLPIFR